MSGKERKRRETAGVRGPGKSFVNRVVLSILKALDDGSEVPGLLCQNCYQKPAKNAYGVIVHESPWTDESTERYMCGPECLEEHFYSTEFNYFNCPDCDRYIRSYSLSSPVRKHYIEEDGEKICLRCHEAGAKLT